MTTVEIIIMLVYVSTLPLAVMCGVFYEREQWNKLIKQGKINNPIKRTSLTPYQRRIIRKAWNETVQSTLVDNGNKKYCHKDH